MAQLKAYKAWVKTLPCCHCRNLGVDPHHIIGVDKMGGMGRTSSDITIMPLCRMCHDDVHLDGGKGWPQTRWMIETLMKAIDDGVLKI